MSKYLGMSLKGEVRESISLDEDDISDDVEDEVFIRQGRHGFKIAEDITLKRPLMAPRHKADKKTRIPSHLKHNKPSCKRFYKPCCYIFAAMSVFLGLITVVVILISIFPLPKNLLHNWFKTQSNHSQVSTKITPCNNLHVTEVWHTVFSKLTTESPIRTIDINSDGVEDILFGFGSGDNYNVLPIADFCNIFMGIDDSCKGGVLVLNGVDGSIMWKTWLNDNIYNLQCNADLNFDEINDCLATGSEGTLAVLNGKNGTVLWKIISNTNVDIFAATFIPDQNNDNISDILASHSSISNPEDGKIVLISGKTGKTLNKIKFHKKLLYMPQLLKQNESSVYVVFGCGGPSTPGSLVAIPLNKLFDSVNNNNITMLHSNKDNDGGVLTESILVDITGDEIADIIIAVFRSHVLAIDGQNFEQIWNWTVPSMLEVSKGNMVPTPAYFNNDNVTDFLVVFQMYDNITNTNFTQTFIIDGKTGESIYDPILNTVASQMNSLTLSMERYGYDMYLFWSLDCKKMSVSQKTSTTSASKNRVTSFFLDECKKQFNANSVLKLNALSQFHEPPGFTVFDTVNCTNYTVENSILKEVRNYLLLRSEESYSVQDIQQDTSEPYYNINEYPTIYKNYESSSPFHRKDSRKRIFIKDYNKKNFLGLENDDNDDISTDYQPIESVENTDDIGHHLDKTNLNVFNNINYNNNDKIVLSKTTNNRDPRSKQESKKKNLSDLKFGIYGYKNIQRAKDRLLSDQNSIPEDILRDTYFKNLPTAKFRQRDINNNVNVNAEIQQLIEEEKENLKNLSYNLWDLESDKEIEENIQNQRFKRKVRYGSNGSIKISSVGAVLDSFNKADRTISNVIDIAFIVYWQKINKNQQEILDYDMEKCIATKSNEQPEKNLKTIEQECVSEQNDLKKVFPHFEKLYQLKFGELIVYRLRLQCVCQNTGRNEYCAKFLRGNNQSWPNFLGKFGDGIYRARS